MVFIAVFADVVGRKPALVVGLLATAASAALFIVATMSPPWLAFRRWGAKLRGRSIVGRRACDQSDGREDGQIHRAAAGGGRPTGGPATRWPGQRVVGRCGRAVRPGGWPVGRTDRWPGGQMAGRPVGRAGLVWVDETHLQADETLAILGKGERNIVYILQLYSFRLFGKQVVPQRKS